MRAAPEAVLQGPPFQYPRVALCLYFAGAPPASQSTFSEPQNFKGAFRPAAPHALTPVHDCKVETPKDISVPAQRLPIGKVDEAAWTFLRESHHMSKTETNSRKPPGALANVEGRVDTNIYNQLRMVVDTAETAI